MTVSITLRKVANSSFYSGNPCEDYMCLSLEDAFISGLITKKERDEAREEVRKFIKPFNTMSNFLIENGGSDSHQYKKAIYSDWDNRYAYLRKELTFWQKVKLFFKRNHHA